MIKPRQPVPSLEAPTVDGDTWRLADQTPESFTMLVFYRGLHCPICSRYLGDLNRKAEDFAKRGVEVIVLSSDGEERARQARADWKLDKLTVGYGFGLDAARDWGLYISAGIGKTSAGVEEPAQFSEPGLFLVRPDGTLYFSTVQTMPFSRPSFGDILPAIDFVLERNYPARGEV
jgi:peroxiredoxin